MKNRYDFRIGDNKQASEHAKFVINRLYDIPSMAVKLPKYILERIDMLVEYGERTNWEFLDD